MAAPATPLAAPRSKQRIRTEASKKPAVRPAGPSQVQRDAAAPWPLADSALNEQLRGFAAGLVGPEVLQRALTAAFAAGRAALAPGGNPGDDELQRRLRHFAAGNIAPVCMHRILNEAFGKRPDRAGPYLGPQAGWRRVPDLAIPNSVWTSRPRR